ncbi:hypothetical protein MPTK1_7g15170 [Marchantia polymorpha subsp. ruderalis]|uniref:Uncharacterized protein n=2 Tax=Marchantia polymorpha TaxID=3197 RepID=A0AAF6BZT1_MARPO|nr:hypothetical protein MARPO_0009s0201 [Marchantia polymorpha]BBN17515.1 hypothetical protein Mp_7g15170 [Marchantia polymorpha subsp. ruderalis]|eukprot:PTQ47121.1 hypothetical protein MARPO_0009s0201 [Marchantia polymorpha]
MRSHHGMITHKTSLKESLCIVDPVLSHAQLSVHIYINLHTVLQWLHNSVSRTTGSFPGTSLRERVWVPPSITQCAGSSPLYTMISAVTRH